MNHPKGTRLEGQNPGELAEEALRESEEKFRACFAHAPAGNVGLPELADLLDTSSIQRLMDDFYAFSHVPMAIVDAKGRVLVGVGWQEICTQFHRVNPESCRHCLESDLYLSAGLGQGESRLYKCKNHMWDMATPIFVAGQQVGNVFTGQFFFEDETVDRSLFSAQARRYGFNEAKYLSALERVPRLSRETVQRGMDFLVNLADTISHLGYSNVKLARLLAERKQAEDALRLSEEKFSVAFEENPAAITITRLEDGLFYDVNDTWLKLNGYSRDEVVGQFARQLLIWPSAEAANRFLAELKASGSVRGWEQEFRKKSGELFVAQLSAQILTVRNERVILSTLVDITERKRAEARLLQLNRTLQARNACSHALLTAENEAAFLEQACRIISDNCGHAMVWIGFAEQDAAKTVRAVACAGFEQGYLETLRLTWADSERGGGPTGTAIRTAKPNMCRNIHTDPRMAPWREEARKRGYASSLVLPLLEGDKAFGAITIYSKGPDPFSAEEVEALGHLAAELAQGIMTLRLRQAHKLAEEALQESKDKLALALRSAGMGVWRLELPESKRHFDEQVCHCLGIDPARFIGTAQEFYAAVHPEDHAHLREALAQTMATGASYEVEYRAVWPAGGVHYIAARGKLSRDAAGQPQGIDGLLWDITERKEAEEALRESERQFRTLADSIPHLAWWANADGYITWYNRRWYEYTGTTPEQMEGWGWQSVHDPAVLPRVLERWKASLATGQPFEMEFPLRGADGRFHWFLTRVLPLRDATGQVTRWFGTNTDVSETREAREVLARSQEELARLVTERTAKLNEMVGELEHFSYTLIHDMRAPLRAMHALGEMLLEQCAECAHADRRDFLRRITAASLRMDSLITDSLNYSKAVRERLDLEPVNVKALLEDMLDSYPQLQPHKDHIKIAASLPMVLGNKAGLTQCFSNLLSNAVKFVAPGQVPQIRVWAETQGDAVRLNFQDNGIGIPKQYQQQIWVMFQRLSKAYEGTGIGLALVRKVMQRMGGNAGVESEPGHGSCFWLELKRSA